MGGNMKTVLVAAVAAALAVAAQGAAGFRSDNKAAVMKDGVSIRKCDFPFQWSRTTGGPSDDQWCNERVYCVDDAQSPNSPWYVLQSRTNNKGEAFNKNYQDYEMGFGESLVDDFWLGLWCLQKMTGPSNNELLVRVVDKQGTAGTALYSTFSLGLPASKYQLRVEGFDAQKSDMGDSMSQSNGMPFTALDEDNDRNANRNCAEKYKGGWWYNDCKINAVNNFLNGYFSLGPQRRGEGVQWQTWGTQSAVVSTLIVFRPQDSRLIAPNPDVGANRNRPQPAVATQMSSSGPNPDGGANKNWPQQAVATQISSSGPFPDVGANKNWPQQAVATQLASSGPNPDVNANRNKPQQAVATQLASPGRSAPLPEQPALGLDSNYYDEAVDDEFFYPKTPYPSGTAAVGAPNSPRDKEAPTFPRLPLGTAKKPPTGSGWTG